MTKVIFTAPNPRFNSRPAKEFGEPVFLVQDERELNPFGGQETLAKIVERLQELEYDPTQDFIAMTGNIVLVSMLAMCASELSEDSTIKTLVYDARGGGSYKYRDVNPQEA